MSKTAKEIIADAVELINTGSPDARFLWSILTALRGPDFSDTGVKHRTTTRIRGAIGMNKNFSVGASVDTEPVEALTEADKQACHDSWHFIQHFNWARETLVTLGYIKPDGSLS